MVVATTEKLRIAGEIKMTTLARDIILQGEEKLCNVSYKSYTTGCGYLKSDSFKCCLLILNQKPFDEFIIMALWNGFSSFQYSGPGKMM